jgi:hypothetical protein
MSQGGCCKVLLVQIAPGVLIEIVCASLEAIDGARPSRGRSPAFSKGWAGQPAGLRAQEDLNPGWEPLGRWVRTAGWSTHASSCPRRQIPWETSTLQPLSPSSTRNFGGTELMACRRHTDNPAFTSLNLVMEFRGLCFCSAASAPVPCRGPDSARPTATARPR